MTDRERIAALERRLEKLTQLVLTIAGQIVVSSLRMPIPTDLTKSREIANRHPLDKLPELLDAVDKDRG